MCMNSSVGQWCQRLTSPVGASGFTGDTGATGQTGVTGGWTLPHHMTINLELILGGV